MTASGDIPEKASIPNDGASPQMVMLVRLVQSRKAPHPMLVTPSGILMLFRLVHPRKAEIPMLVTLSPIVMLVRLLQL